MAYPTHATPHPTIETLPPELLEKIYIHSENLFLPFTSPHLNRVLTHPVTTLHFASYIFSYTFTSTYGNGGGPTAYTDPIFAADNARDIEICSLQNTLINEPWFTDCFARRLEALTPELQNRSRYRRKEDLRLRHHLQPAEWPVTGPDLHERTVLHLPGEAPRNVYMPTALLIGQWTNAKAELFHRLRGWYIDPISSRDHEEKTLFRQARKQATQDGREDIVAELDWYMKAESAGVHATCMMPVIDLGLEAQLCRDFDEAIKRPLPDHDEDALCVSPNQHR